METSITPAELKQLLKHRENLMIIDVRSLEEYSEQHISFAENIPVDIIESGIFIPEHGKIIVTICTTGCGR